MDAIYARQSVDKKDVSISVTESFDPSSPMGPALFSIVSVFAQPAR